MNIQDRAVLQQGVRVDPVKLSGDLEWQSHIYKQVRRKKPKKAGRWY